MYIFFRVRLGYNIGNQGSNTNIIIQERSGRTLFGRISNNIPENDVGVCRNIGLLGTYFLGKDSLRN